MPEKGKMLVFSEGVCPLADTRGCAANGAGAAEIPFAAWKEETLRYVISHQPRRSSPPKSRRIVPHRSSHLTYLIDPQLHHADPPIRFTGGLYAGDSAPLGGKP